MMHRRPSSSDIDPMIGKVFAQRYELRSQLGAGGMAIVYGAHDNMLQRDVAVKILRPEISGDSAASKRLRREAKAAGRLHHPHIITFHDVGVADGQVFIVMELLRGQSLTGTRLQAGGQIPYRRVARIGAQIASALQCVHDANIVHRDLKPENVFVFERGGEDYVKLLDFSIAKLPDGMVDGRLTQTGAVFGTPHYMAPEQAQGEAVGFPTDLYALGALLFEMLTGKPPFEADNAIKLLTKQSLETAPRVSSKGVTISLAFDELIAAMLEKVPWHRPAGAAAVLSQLERIAAGEDGGPMTGRQRGRAKRRLTGDGDTTQQGYFNAKSAGGVVRSPSAVYRQVSGIVPLQHDDPPPTAQRDVPPAVPLARVRKSTEPGRSLEGASRTSSAAVANESVNGIRSTQPRSKISAGRKKRATIPSWPANTDALDPDSEATLDDDETI